MARTVVGLRELLRQPQDVDHEALWYGMEHSDFLLRKGRMDAEHWMKRALLLYSFRRYEEAVTCLTMVLAERPADGEAYFLKGVCYQLMALDRAPDMERPAGPALALFEKALACFRAATRLAPADEEAPAAARTLASLLGHPFDASIPTAPPADPPGLGRIPPLPKAARKPDAGKA